MSKKNLTLLIFSFLFIQGCGQQKKAETDVIDPTAAIGELVEVFTIDTVPVEGYSIVGELNGTGSEECPVELEEYLAKYIRTEIPTGSLDVREFIKSRDTAVVRVAGYMPARAVKNKKFDVKVQALPNTQTTSLKNGVLYGCDLGKVGTIGTGERKLAEASGPIYLDHIKANTDLRNGFIIGGGRSLETFRISLAVNKPNYRRARLISKRINDRFGDLYANPSSPGMIRLRLPEKYYSKKRRFIDVIKKFHLNPALDNNEKNIKKHINMLVSTDNVYDAEVTLEGIGKIAIPYIKELLDSNQEKVRFRAARCLLYLGDDTGLDVLRDIAFDENSERRMEVIQAVSNVGKKSDIANLCRLLVKDKDFDIALAAYQQLHEIGDFTIKKDSVDNHFLFEQIAISDRKAVYVSRSETPKIVVFGAPLETKKDIFVQTDDRDITLNSPPELNYISIIRKHPRRENVNLKLSSSFSLENLIKRMGESPSPESKFIRPGLGISYSHIIEILEKMTNKGSIDAEFHLGPLPKIDI